MAKNGGNSDTRVSGKAAGLIIGLLLILVIGVFGFFAFLLLNPSNGGAAAASNQVAMQGQQVQTSSQDIQEVTAAYDNLDEIDTISINGVFAYNKSGQNETLMIVDNYKFAVLFAMPDGPPNSYLAFYGIVSERDGTYSVEDATLSGARIIDREAGTVEITEAEDPVSGFSVTLDLSQDGNALTAIDLDDSETVFYRLPANESEIFLIIVRKLHGLSPGGQVISAPDATITHANWTTVRNIISIPSSWSYDDTWTDIEIFGDGDGGYIYMVAGWLNDGYQWLVDVSISQWDFLFNDGNRGIKLEAQDDSYWWVNGDLFVFLYPSASFVNNEDIITDVARTLTEANLPAMSQEETAVAAVPPAITADALYGPMLISHCPCGTLLGYEFFLLEGWRFTCESRENCGIYTRRNIVRADNNALRLSINEIQFWEEFTAQDYVNAAHRDSNTRTTTRQGNAGATVHEHVLLSVVTHNYPSSYDIHLGDRLLNIVNFVVGYFPLPEYRIISDSHEMINSIVFTSR